MKPRESLLFKIAAIMLSFITAMVTAASVIAIVFMVCENYYTVQLTDIKNEIMTRNAQNEVFNIYQEYDWENKPADYAKSRGIYYTITDSKTEEVLESNYSGESYLAKSKQEDFQTYIFDETAESYIQNGYIDITVYIPSEKSLSTSNKVLLKITEILYRYRFNIIWIAALFLILTIILLCYLYAAAGHRKGGEIALNFLDRIPFDIITAVVIGLAILNIPIIDSAITSTFLIAFSVITLTVAADYLIVFAYTMTFSTRIKKRTLITNNIIYKTAKFMGKYLKRFLGFLRYNIKNIPLVFKTAIVCVLVSIIWMMVALRIYYTSDTFILTLLFLIFLSLAAIFISITLQKIKVGGERIASGDLEHKIDTQYMYGDFKDFAEKLNHINDGLSVAINERMKSEHFKTELITNVSHDIKTPLTSIINYVDLIKKEEPENEKIKEYIEVLDRQSGRLKKLIEDLVEASKASTGNIAVNLSDCEVGVLLSQTIGEFDEKLKSAELTPVLKQPEKPVIIKADGRHLWRVFDNLMNNVCKYSLKGTRVYLDVAEQDGKAVITFRNISAFELNLSSEELTERFVRGDKSRGTEGSGLGLSIARSLTELQDGIFNIKVDGDLFKVTLIFPITR